ncbi:MAG: extracellular solute-binding protein [Anaerolineae bacterium]|nr:extracellular solute-binding protein [Anaerolineae bacterium]
MLSLKSRQVSRVLLIVTLLAGLFGFVTSDRVARAQTDVSGSLNVLGFSLPDEIATTRVDAFKAAYPNVQLNITEGSLDEQQFLTSVASGTPPDLVYMDRDLLSTYAVRGAIMPLTECIQNQGIDMSQYREAAVQQVTVNGVVYGIPEFFNIILLIVNEKALQDAGLTLDDVDTSDWNKIADLNNALTKNENGTVTRIGFDPKLPEFLPLWAMANGASLLSDDGKTAQLNDPKVVEALDFAVKLHDAAGGRQSFIAFRDTWDFFGANNQFVADQLGAFPMEQWYVNVLADTTPDAPVAFKPFTDRNGQTISYSTGNAWAIPKGSANPDAACAMMKTMTAPETWEAAAQARADLRTQDGKTNTGVYTANTVADEAIFGDIVKPSGSEKFDNAVEVIRSVQDAAFSIPANPAGAEFRQAWQDAVNRVLNGEQTAQDALDQAQSEAQAALDAAWSQQTQ